jgi:hypothetical protein
MNTNLLNALKQIISQHGGVETLSDARRVKALLADLAAGEPKPQKNALIACLEQGFAVPLRNIPPGDRKTAKARMAERLNREEGLDPALCADTLDLLEAALFGKKAAGTAPSGGAVCPACGAALPEGARFCPACGAAAASGTVKPAAAAPAPQRPAVAARKVSPQQPVAAARKISPPQPAVAAPAPQKKEVWRELQILTGHDSIVSSVAYSPDGRQIVSGSDDCTVRIWDAEIGRLLRTWRHTDKVNSVTYSPDGRQIAAALDNGFKIWDVASWRELPFGNDYDHPSITTIVYRPDGRQIATVDEHGRLIIWDVASGRELRGIGGDYADMRSSPVAYSPNGSRIVSRVWNWFVRGGNHRLKISDAVSGQELKILNCHALSVAYSPDGRRILSGSTDGIKIWDAESGWEMQTLSGDPPSSYSPDGRRIVSASTDGIKIWDAETGRLLQTLKGHTYGATSVAYSPDGRRIASGSVDGPVKIWGAE